MTINIDFLANNPQHIPTIAQWIYAEWAQYDPTLSVARATESLQQRLHTDKVPLCLIATLNGDLAGCVSLKDSIRIPGYEDRNLWLGNLIVAEQYRNQGIGSALLQYTYNKAKDLGFKKISLFSTVPDALDWYLKQGWTQFAKDTYQGNTAWLFEYTL